MAVQQATEAAGRGATRARPRLLILYHRSNPGARGASAPEAAVLSEMRKYYNGKWVSGHDLDIY